MLRLTEKNPTLQQPQILCFRFQTMFGILSASLLSPVLVPVEIIMLFSSQDTFFLAPEHIISPEHQCEQIWIYVGADL